MDIIPLEVIVRNIAAGSMAKRFGIEEGTPLKHPILEFCYKNDELGDPFANESQITALGWATQEQLDVISTITLKVNDILKKFLATKNVTLVDFKLEFGTHNGEVLLGDEISPDTCRFWDATTGEKLDKDRFRRDLGNIEEAYKRNVIPSYWRTRLRGTMNYDPVFDKWHEECGVFGVYDRTVDVARYVYWGLFALQHRGQESAGIAVTDGHDVELKKVWAC